MNNLLVVLLITIGIYLIIKGSLNCTKQEKVIEYRFIPRTLKEEQADPPSVVDMFKNMFIQESLIPNVNNP